MMLGGELSAHPGFGAGAAPPSGQPNRRNGGTTKRVIVTRLNAGAQVQLWRVWIRICENDGSTFTPSIFSRIQRAAAVSSPQKSCEMT